MRAGRRSAPASLRSADGSSEEKFAIATFSIRNGREPGDKAQFGPKTASYDRPGEAIARSASHRHHRGIDEYVTKVAAVSALVLSRVSTLRRAHGRAGRPHGAG